MKDPRRLSAEAETSELVQSLLAAGRARREPEGARERVWAALAVGMASGAATSAAGVAATKATSGLASGAGAGVGGASAKGASFAVAIGKAKLLAIGAVVAATAAGAATIAVDHGRAPEEADRVVAQQPVPAKSPAREAVSATPEQANVDPPEAQPAAAERTEAVATATPNEVHPHARRSASATGNHAPASTLREEAELLREIRAALTRGDHDSARAKLDEARARFPTSQLAPERDALEVRLASVSGDPERAARLARAFVERYPDSPLRSGIESLARPTEKD